jgi:acetolactate synthase-1/2/3 large subunit
VTGGTGAASLVAALERLGVRHAFGLPGTQNVALFEALRDSTVRTIVPTHELAAAFMAGAYHRASGRPGVLVSIPGPGFAYTLPGLAEARLDSAALLHVTGAPPTGPGSRFRLQELEQAAIASPLVKGRVVVARPADMSQAVERAHAAALAGEPGPVMIEVAEAAWGSSDEGRAEQAATDALSPQGTAADPGPVLDRLRAARRVVVFAGQGAQGASEAVRGLAERLGSPVVTTGSGRGVVPEDHPLAMGYDNARGTVDDVNGLLESADLVLILGAKLGHNGTAGFRLRLPSDRTAQVDAATEVPGANYPVAASATSTVERFLDQVVLSDLQGGGWPAAEVAGWRDRISRAVPRAEPSLGGRSAPDFFRRLRAGVPREAVLATDSGLHQILARRYFDVLSPRGLLIPADFQAMGFGIPAAIGARLAAPDRPVVALVGDGGFAMSGLELATAVREAMDLVVVVCSDGHLGQIRMQQIGEFGRAAGTRLPAMDYAALADAVGARYGTLDHDPAAAIEEALRGGVWLLEVTVGDSLAVVGHRLGGAGRRLGRQVVPGLARSYLRAFLRKLLRR